jgi:hypothetical protein
LAGIGVAPAGLLGPAAGAGALAGALTCYTRWRPRPVIAAASRATLVLVLFTTTGAALSYAVTAAALPLQDARLAAADAALGFAWPAWLETLAAHPPAARALTLVYKTALLQVLLVLFLAAAAGDARTLDRFAASFVLGGTACILVSGLVPAAGAYVHHAPDPAATAGLDPLAGRWHLEHFLALREGRFAVLDLATVEGLVTFPSFHTVLGVLLADALRARPWGAVPGALAAVLVALSALLIGGHYLVDALAGAATAFLALAAARRMLGQAGRETAAVAWRHASSPPGPVPARAADPGHAVG